MFLLVVGVTFWWGAHLLKRLVPDVRSRVPKGAVAGLLVLSVILMVIGYRGADFVAVWSPLPGMGHLNNAAMLVSVFLFGVGGTKGLLYTRMRHPMLWGTVIWSVAHLLVNGDLASVLLFGGIGLWALVEMAVINRTPWQRPAAGRGIKGDAMNLVGTLILYAVAAGVHIWLGHNPFMGTYG